MSAAPARAATPSSSAVPSGSSPVPSLALDTLARTTVEGVSVRAEPTTAAERLAVLAGGERVYLVEGPVEADGYSWYRVAPGEDRFATDCSQPAAASALSCAQELGWAAAVTADGERWMESADPGCPTARDTDAYLALEAVERLVCAGSEPWRLVAYLAPEAGGRGCFPVWVVDPSWMDGSCNFFFPQPTESQLDADTRLQAFVPPELGSCDADGCPFDELKGSWVEITGHLDDPAAETCTMVLSTNFEEAPYPPVGPELTIFNCRLNLVVDAVQPTDPPADG